MQLALITGVDILPVQAMAERKVQKSETVVTRVERLEQVNAQQIYVYPPDFPLQKAFTMGCPGSPTMAIGGPRSIPSARRVR